MVVEGQPVQQRVENVFTLRFGRGWGWMGRWERVRGGERVRRVSRLVRSEKRTDGFGRTLLKLCRVMIG